MPGKGTLLTKISRAEAEERGITPPSSGKGAQLECLKCGYPWVQRKDTLPKECPDCKRRSWNRKD